MRRAWIVSALAVLVGCTPAVSPERPPPVATTEAGGRCLRECLAQGGLCRGACPQGLWVLECREDCRTDQVRCEATCPGVTWP